MSSVRVEMMVISEGKTSPYFQDLQRVLDKFEGELDVSVERSNETHQNFGDTFIMIIGSKVAIELAKALGDWIRKHHGVGLKIKLADGTSLEVTDATTESAEKLLSALTNARSSVE